MADRFKECLARAQRAVIWLTAFGIPVVFLRSTFDPFDAPKLALLFAGTGLALLLAMSIRDPRTPAMRALVGPATAVGLPITVAWVASDHKAWALLGEYSRYQGWLPTVTAAALGLLAARAFAARPALLAGAVVAAGAVVGGYALVQMLGLDPLEWFESAYVASTMGHSNFSGGLLAMALPLALGVWAAGGRWTPFARAAAIVIAVALIGTFSQGAWVAGAAGIVFFAGWIAPQRSRLVRRMETAIVAALLLAPVLLVVAAQTFLEPQLAGSSIWTRGLHWGTAVAVAADHPLTGAGPNGFAIAAAAHRSPAEVLIAGRADDPHSVPLAWFANHGVLGLIGFTVLLAWIVRRWSRVGSDPIAVAFLAALTAYLVQALVTIDEVALRSTFWIALAGTAISTQVAAEPPPNFIAATSIKGAGRILGAVLAAGLIYIGGRVIVTDHHAARALHAATRGDVRLAERELRSAVSGFGQMEYRNVVGGRLGRTAIDAGNGGGEFIQGMQDAYAPVLDFPSVEWRGSYAYWLSQWSVFDPLIMDEALKAWAHTRLIDPNDPRIAIQRGDLLVRMGEATEAVQELGRFLRLMEDVPLGTPPLPEFWGALAIARTSSQDLEGGLAAYERGLALDPNACRVLVAGEILAEKGIIAARDDRELLISLTCDPVVAEVDI